MSRTAKNAVIIMVATLLSRVLGFLRETILANFYGTSMVADVFVLTFNIPGLIISIVGSVIYMMYIPMYYDTRDRLGEDEALKFTNNILNILSVFSIIVSILGIIFAGEIIKIFAIGFIGENLHTWSPFKLWDPENATTDEKNSGVRSGNAYPINRTYSCYIKLSF